MDKFYPWLYDFLERADRNHSRPIRDWLRKREDLVAVVKELIELVPKDDVYYWVFQKIYADEDMRKLLGTLEVLDINILFL